MIVSVMPERERKMSPEFNVGVINGKEKKIQAVSKFDDIILAPNQQLNKEN